MSSGSVAPMRWHWPAGIVALMAIVAAMMGLGPVLEARAAQNTAIEITVTSFDRSDRLGNPTPGRFEIWNYAKLSFDWDASNANPQPGDSFRIGLPPEFWNFEETTLALRDDTGVVAGQCVVTTDAFECTLNEAIVGKTDIKGSGSLVIQASAITTEQQVTFDLNGTATPLTVPGGEGVQPIGYSEWDLDKWRPELTASSTVMEWQVAYSSAWVANVATGGQYENMTYTLVDTVAPGHVFSDDLSTWELRLGSTPTHTDPAVIALADGTVVTTEFGDQRIQVSLNDTRTEATITVSGTMLRQANYSVKYRTLPSTADGVIQPGFVYENTVRVPGTDVVHTGSTYYAQAATISIEMQDGFGGFSVQKLLKGSGATAVAAGTTFTVNVAWTLPEGRTPADYPSWTAPASNPTTLEVTAGQRVVFPLTFPVGTEIVLSEDPASANPAPSGVTWGDPEFTVGGPTAQTATFTITNQTSTAVDLANTVEPAVTPTPTPTPTPSDTATPTPTPSDTATPTPTPSDTATPTPTPSDTATPTPTPSDTPSESPSPTPTTPDDQPPSLARTGTEDVAPVAVAAAVLLLIGGLLLGRRRSV